MTAARRQAARAPAPVTDNLHGRTLDASRTALVLRQVLCAELRRRLIARGRRP